MRRIKNTAPPPFSGREAVQMEVKPIKRGGCRGFWGCRYIIKTDCNCDCGFEGSRLSRRGGEGKPQHKEIYEKEAAGVLSGAVCPYYDAVYIMMLYYIKPNGGMSNLTTALEMPPRVRGREQRSGLTRIGPGNPPTMIIRREGVAPVREGWESRASGGPRCLQNVSYLLYSVLFCFASAADRAAG